MGSVGLEDGSKRAGARVEVGWRERGSGNLEIWNSGQLVELFWRARVRVQEGPRGSSSGSRVWG